MGNTQSAKQDSTPELGADRGSDQGSFTPGQATVFNTIEEIGTRPFGNLLISVAQDRGDQARAFLEQHGLTTEVLGHVR